MKNRSPWSLIALLCIPLIAGANCGCEGSAPPAKSASGVSIAQVTVEVGPDGLTATQRNVAKRLKRDNTPGVYKFVYVISCYTGQVMYQSIALPKVESSGRRLTPSTVAIQRWSDGSSSNGVTENGFSVNIGGHTHYTHEVLQDDGGYGSSIEYLYWFDQNDGYHQQYVTGGVTLHVSDVPLIVRQNTLTMELDEAFMKALGLDLKKQRGEK